MRDRFLYSRNAKIRDTCLLLSRRLPMCVFSLILQAGSLCHAQTYSDPPLITLENADYPSQTGVDLRSQAFSVSRTDISIGREHDDSLLTVERQWSSDKMYWPNFQYNFQWGYDDRLAGSKTIVFSNGIERYEFHKVKTSNSVSDTSLFENKSFDGSHLSLSTEYGDTEHFSYVLHLTDGRKLFFSSNFKSSDSKTYCKDKQYKCASLMKVVYPSGSQIKYVRDALKRVTMFYNSYGYGIYLTYGAYNNPLSATAVDMSKAGCSRDTGQCSKIGEWPSVTYTYDEVLVSADNDKNVILSSVTDAAGNTENYGYYSYTEEENCQLTNIGGLGVRRTLWALSSITKGKSSIPSIKNVYNVGCYPYSSTISSQSVGGSLDASYVRDYNFQNGHYQNNYKILYSIGGVVRSITHTKVVSGNSGITPSARVVSVTDANNITKSFEYDGYLRLKKTVRSDGLTVSYSYDANNNIISKVNSAKNLVDISVSRSFNTNCTSPRGCNTITSSTDGRATVTNYSYADEHGLLKKTLFAADGDGKVLSVNLDYKAYLGFDGETVYKISSVSNKNNANDEIISLEKFEYSDITGNIALLSSTKSSNTRDEKTCFSYDKMGNPVQYKLPLSLC